MSKRNQPAKAEEDYRKDYDREEKQSYDGPEWIVPNDKNGLKACFHCGMIKTKSQWQSA